MLKGQLQYVPELSSLGQPIQSRKHALEEKGPYSIKMYKCVFVNTISLSKVKEAKKKDLKMTAPSMAAILDFRSEWF